MAAKCEKCGLIFNGFSGDMVILRNQLWAKISGDNIKLVLCDKCIEKELGRSIELKDLSPGIPGNKIYLSNHPALQNSSEYSDRRECECCGEKVYLRLYLRTEVWEKEIGDPRLFLCPECIEKKLGRLLTKEDLVPGMIVNRVYLRSKKKS